MKVEFDSIFGAKVFNESVMKERLSNNAYEHLRRVRDEAEIVDLKYMDEIAEAIKEWALEQGATHFLHWHSPLTGTNAGRHDSFLDGTDKEGKPIVNFSGKQLVKAESDGSSFPSGGLRSTFEARGYTIWDTTSPCFVMGTTLYVPTAFTAFTGEALDYKTPLLRSSQQLNKQAVRLFKALGFEDVTYVKPTLGAEQEYFLVDKELFDKRQDLRITGRTIFGAQPAKGQELSDHYYGATPERVREFMRDVDDQLWQLGVSAKTEHNEVAPGQFELACVYTYANIAADQNQIVMDVMKRTALRHGFVCLLYEKPFLRINGSGKHNNYSLVTSTGENLLSPGKEPEKNIKFLITLAAFIKGVDEHADLLRLSVTTAGNDFRLGEKEAPPAIVSMYLGSRLESVLEAAAEGHISEHEKVTHDILLGSKSLPLLTVDEGDRNRTAPFAFTGTKFEFRMVGSSQPLGFVNTVINSIVSANFREFAKEIEASEKKISKAYEIVTRTYVQHKRILFSGNAYSNEWVEEAARRGLPNLDCTVKAIPVFIKPENIEFLQKTKALTEDEIYSRYQVMYQQYISRIDIELNVAEEMVRMQILPAAFEYIGDLGKYNYFASSAGYLSKASMDTQKDIAKLADRIRELLDEMVEMHKDAVSQPTIEVQADSLYRAQKKGLSALRAAVDELETRMPKNRWPMPTYEDLWFQL
ncbi:MAG: glutamine synthetase III [Oscillospiraceae bacterium]|nr:glutamine synthetase III [Oscillospiraceae bacterium]